MKCSIVQNKKLYGWEGRPNNMVLRESKKFNKNGSQDRFNREQKKWQIMYQKAPHGSGVN